MPDSAAGAPTPSVTAAASPAQKTAAPEAPDTCADLDACITRLRFLALRSDEFKSLGPAHRALIARIITLDGATPRLVVLLADPDPDVAQLAAAALRDIPQVDPIYLPQVKAGLDRGLVWLPPVLGRMDSEEAAREAVARYLVSRDAPHNQEMYALELSGARAIPWIVAHARCKPRCRDNDITVLGYALEGMGPERAEAAPELMAMAEAASSSEQARKDALWLVGSLQEDGVGVQARVLALAEKRPELKYWTDLALVRMKSEASGRILAQRLNKDNDPIVLRDLAILGTAGRSAGPMVVELLHSPDWEIRIAAANALGEIGYEDGTDALIEAAQDPADVRLQWAAVQALARLRANSAKAVLAQLAQHHWYPPLRDAAATALRELDLPPPAPDTYNPDRQVITRFWSWWSMGRTALTCTGVAVKTREIPGTLDGSNEAQRIQLQSLAYAKPERVPPPLPKPGKEVAEPQTKPSVEMKTPQIALRVDDGWLVGSDDGEWGGELMFIDDADRATVIAIRNIQGIHRLSSRIVVLSGLAHMSSNEGVAFELVRQGGQWQLRPWRALPAAPTGGAMTTTGALLVQTSYGGTLLLAADGTLSMAPCKP